MAGDLPLRYALSVPGGAAEDAELPLVLVLHGRGADANDLVDIAPLIDNNYRFIFPNAPEPFEPSPGFSFGFTWFDGWPAEHNSFVRSREVLLRFIDAAVARFPTPPGKIVLSGFSQGGMMSLDAGFRTQQQLAGIVVMSGALNEQDPPPLRPDIPVLMIHGTQDDMIPVLAARRARRVLEERGVHPEYHEFAMGHFVTPESMAVVRDFLLRRLSS
ncbi:MAG: dienelactone hydrolase family protein [Acidobacteriota bacterium]|nr:dienelactone hydrolase family protein [Acidobacteriota bacterium]